MIEEQSVLPNFLIVGAPRCGTTSTYHYLLQHPDVFLPVVKEPSYFSLHWKSSLPKGYVDCGRSKIRSWDSYLGLFKDAQGTRMIGEASTDTLYYHEHTIPEIRKRLANPKIIIMVRNPVDRAFSSHQFLVRDGMESGSFEDSLSHEKTRIEENWSHIWRYRAVSHYATGVQAFMENFDDVFVGVFDDLCENPLKFIQSVFRFLEVDFDFAPNVKLAFNRSGKPASRRIQKMITQPAKWQPIIRALGYRVLGEHGWVRFRDSLKSRFVSPRSDVAQDTRAQLIREFADDINSLQNLVGRDLAHWLRVPEK